MRQFKMKFENILWNGFIASCYKILVHANACNEKIQDERS